MPKCRFPGCNEQAEDRRAYCIIHIAQRESYKALKKQAKKAGVLGKVAGAFSFLLDPNNPIGRGVGGIAGEYAADVQQVVGVYKDAAMGPEVKKAQVNPEEPIDESEEEPEEEDFFEWEPEDEPEIKTDSAKLKAAWSLLGLDADKSTADDVRTTQRKLSSIYHGDTGNKHSAAEEKLKEVNAAASLCIEALKNGK